MGVYRVLITPLEPHKGAGYTIPSALSLDVAAIDSCRLLCCACMRMPLSAAQLTKSGHKILKPLAVTCCALNLTFESQSMHRKNDPPTLNLDLRSYCLLGDPWGLVVN